MICPWPPQRQAVVLAESQRRSRSGERGRSCFDGTETHALEPSHVGCSPVHGHLHRLHGVRHPTGARHQGARCKIDGESVSGTAYFQKVCVQAPSPPCTGGFSILRTAPTWIGLTSSLTDHDRTNHTPLETPRHPAHCALSRRTVPRRNTSTNRAICPSDRRKISLTTG